jgi:hypothetical protein
MILSRYLHIILENHWLSSTILLSNCRARSAVKLIVMYLIQVKTEKDSKKSCFPKNLGFMLNLKKLNLKKSICLEQNNVLEDYNFKRKETQQHCLRRLI